MSELEKKDEYDPNDFRYHRYGYIPGDSFHDSVIARLTSEFVGPALPKHWRYITPERFVAQHQSEESPFVWAMANSAVTLFINGNYAIRIHIYRRSLTATVDIADNVAGSLPADLVAEPMIESVARKYKPFKRRLLIRELSEVDKIVAAIRRTYGL